MPRSYAYRKVYTGATISSIQAGQTPAQPFAVERFASPYGSRWSLPALPSLPQRARAPIAALPDPQKTPEPADPQHIALGFSIAVVLLAAGAVAALWYFVGWSAIGAFFSGLFGLLSSSATSPSGPPTYTSGFSNYYVEFTCGNAPVTVTPLLAMPLVNSTVDLVSGASLASPSAPAPQFADNPYYAECAPGAVGGVGNASFFCRGPALSLSGKVLPLTATVSSSSAFTYALWLYSSGTSNAAVPAVVLGAGGADAGTLCLGLSQSGLFFLGRGVSAGQCSPLTAQAVYSAPAYTGTGPYLSLPGNQQYWTHLVATYQGSAQTACLYVNGTVATCTTGVDWTSAPTGDQLVVGVSLPDLSDPYLGGVQGLAAYDVALSASAARSLYFNQANATGVSKLESYTTFTCVVTSTVSPTLEFLPPSPSFTVSPPTYPTPNAIPGRTFYVSLVNGNDANSGLSTSAPWQTLNNFNTLTARESYAGSPDWVQPGDSLLLCAGDKQFIPQGPNALMFYFGSNDYGTGPLPITIASYTCSSTPAGVTSALISQSGLLPQFSGGVGWEYVSGWAFANGTTSSSAILSYSLADLASAQQFLGVNQQFINTALPVSAVWIAGVQYVLAQHPNVLDFDVQTGVSPAEFLYTDPMLPDEGSSGQPVAIAGGDWCAKIWQGLYGGNSAALAQGAGSLGYFADGVTLLSGRTETWAAFVSLLGEWSPPQYDCDAWYQHYVATPGYTYNATDLWLGSLPFAQSASDPDYLNEAWRPPLTGWVSGFGGGDVNTYVFPWQDSLSRVRQWGGGLRLSNHRALLDAPGEYFYDAPAKVLYLHPLNAGHAQQLTAQSSFTFTLQGCAMALPACSAAYVLMGNNGPAAIGDPGESKYSLYLRLHDLELAYSASGIYIAHMADALLYNLYIHDILSYAIYLTNTSYGNTQVVINTRVNNVAGSSILLTSDKVFWYDNTVSNEGMKSYSNSGYGVQVYAYTRLVARNNTLINMNYMGLLYGSQVEDTQSDVLIEFNTLINISTVFYDSTALGAYGELAYNQLYNTVTNNMNGWVNVPAVGEAHGLQAGGPGYLYFHHNLMQNQSGGCFFASALSDQTFVSNLCIDGAGSDISPFNTAEQQQQSPSVWDNNWFIFLNLRMAWAAYPYIEPWMPQRTQWLVACEYFINEVDVYATAHPGNEFGYALLSNSVYANAFVEAQQAFGVVSLGQQLIDEFGQCDQWGAIQAALKASVRSSEVHWGANTNLMPGGVQYGESNVAQLTANAVEVLAQTRAYQFQLTWQSRVDEAYGSLPWYP